MGESNISGTIINREKREYSKDRVLTFDNAIRSNIASDKIENFYEVADLIINMISNRKIYNQKETLTK